MSGLRLWGIGSGIGVVAIVAGGFFLGVQPALASAAQIDQQTAGLAQQNQISMATLAQLAKQGAKIEDMKVEQETLKKAVPTVLKPNLLIRRFTEVAAIDNVVVETVDPGEAIAYSAPASLASQAVPATGTNGAASTQTTAPAAAAVSTSPALATADPSITAANFTVVPISVTVSGSSSAIIQFTHDIQRDERVFLVNGITTATDETSRVSATLTGYVYTLKR